MKKAENVQYLENENNFLEEIKTNFYNFEMLSFDKIYIYIYIKKKIDVTSFKFEYSDSY